MTYTKKVAFSGAKDYAECNSDMDFKIVFNIHNALSDGSPDPVPSSKKEISFKVRCFENGRADSAAEQNLVSTKADCETLGGSCKTGRTVCGSGLGTKIGTCDDGVCCAQTVPTKCADGAPTGYTQECIPEASCNMFAEHSTVSITGKSDCMLKENTICCKRK